MNTHFAKEDICMASKHMKEKKEKKRKKKAPEFPGGLVVKILGFHYHGPGSIPGQGTENPHT